MRVERLDHLVLTVADIDATVAFYCTLLGMRRVDFGESRVALAFGRQKINLHLAGREIEPKAGLATPGSADLCFIVDTPVDHSVAELKAAGIEIIEGPVTRTGATGTIRSLYFRDPDHNLIEVSNYVDKGESP